jgi:hypothetical protein
MTRTIAIVLVSLVLAAASPSVPAGWNPAVFGADSTLEFYTVDKNGNGHWSTVWLVVIDGAPYIRLGSRASERIEENTAKPIVKVRIRGQVFERVIAESAPEMVDKVAAAMADKYWSDVFVRNMNHPLTMRLIPVPDEPPAASTDPSASVPADDPATPNP